MAHASTTGGVPLHKKSIFTTGEAADLCNVSQQTIIRCFDSGRLGGFRVPGSKFRRIPRDDLIKFMKDNDMDASMFLQVPQVLILHLGTLALASFAKSDKYSVTIAESPEEFLVRLLTFQVAIVYGDGERNGGWIQTLGAILADLPLGNGKPRVAFVCPNGLHPKFKSFGIDVRPVAPTLDQQLRDLQVIS